MVKVVKTDFKTLRRAYIDIKSFLEKETGEDVVSLETKLVDDLRCAGDDNLDLLNKFASAYNLNFEGFEYLRHFQSEAELFDSLAALRSILSLPFVLAIWVIKTVTLGRVNLDRYRLIPGWQRETLDMSFGDILTWYLSGNYNLRANIKFVI